MNNNIQKELDLTIEERLCRVKLTKSEQKVLDFIMIQRDVTCYYSSDELAEAARVSGSTVVRLAYKLGYEKFSQFRRALQLDAAQKKKNNIQVQPSINRLQNVWGKDEKTILNEGNAIQIRNISESYRRNGAEKFIKAADKILTARKVFLVGYRMATGCVDFFGRLLKLSRDNVVCITSIGMMTEEMYDLTDEDCVVLISMPRHSENALMTLQHVHERQAYLIVMTDQATSVVASGAQCILIAERTGNCYFNSYLGVWANIEMLLSVISKKSFDETAKRLELREKYLDQNRQY